jgi:hypothetical protein
MGIQRSSITSTTDFINLDTEFLPQVIEKLSHNALPSSAKPKRRRLKILRKPRYTNRKRKETQASKGKRNKMANHETET